MVLGTLPVSGRPTIWITVGQGPTALTVGAGGGCLDIFTLLYPFSPLSPSLWETARYRTEILSQRAVKPKTTNQPTNTPGKRKKQTLFVRNNILSLPKGDVGKKVVFIYN